MILVRYALGMLGVALSVMGTTWTRGDCRDDCGPLAAAQWEANEVLPGLAGLIGGMVALAFPFAGAAQGPPVAGPVPADLDPESPIPADVSAVNASPAGASPDRAPLAGPALVSPALVSPPSAG